MNKFAKTRDIEKPYATYRVENPSNGMYFEWKVLKAWQGRESEKKKPYGRWFCAVKSPMTCLLYTSPSPRDGLLSRMPSSA